MELRREVFCDEQGVSLASERDGRDGRGAIHLVAVDDRVIGTCRLIVGGRTATLSRMAVAPGRRRQGTGAALLNAAEAAARDRRAKRISLHAQIRAQAFYDRAGYRAKGRRFVEEGIDHVAMEKRLA